MTAVPPADALSPGQVARVVVWASWVGLLGSLAWRARGRRSAERRRDPVSLAGLALEGVAFFGIFHLRDASRALPAASPPAIAWPVVALAALLLVASVLLADRALAVLGSQWRVVASVAADDRLVMDGPYAYVRHPVYTAMFGILVGTGMLLAAPAVVAASTVVYFAGTSIRIRSEERLLRARFGASQDAYARAVPALLPRWGGRSKAV